MADGKTIEQRIEEAAERVGQAIGNGFDASDLGVLARESVEVAEAIGELHALDGAQKREVAITLFQRFLELARPHVQRIVDLIADKTDGPGPEAIVDPIVKAIGPEFVIKFMELCGPSILDLVVEASAGRVKVNIEREEG